MGKALVVQMVPNRAKRHMYTSYFSEVLPFRTIASNSSNKISMVRLVTEIPALAKCQSSSENLLKTLDGTK